MRGSSSIGQLAHQPGLCGSCLVGELDADLLLVDTLEIALVIAELNLLLQLLAGLLVAKVIAGQFCLVQLVQNLKLVLLNKSLGSSAVSREGTPVATTLGCSPLR